MSVSDVARDLVSLLVPVLPFLASMGVGASGEVGRRAAEKMLPKLESIWRRFFTGKESDSDLLDVARRVAESPSDERLRIRLSCELEKIIEKDGTLLADCTRVLAEARGELTQLQSTRSVQASSITGSVVITGDVSLQ